jgi:fatty acid desaturase/ferredoxin
MILPFCSHKKGLRVLALKIRDYPGFVRALKALGAQARSEIGRSDLRHLQKTILLNRLLLVLGLGLAVIGQWSWLVIAAACIAISRTMNWAIVAHHVSHGGYEQVPGIAERFCSHRFARGWRRVIDWMDWILPEAWDYEHNTLHHAFTNHHKDPDLVEANLDLLRTANMPRWQKTLIFYFYMCTWKLTYYAPSTLVCLLHPNVDYISPILLGALKRKLAAQGKTIADVIDDGTLADHVSLERIADTSHANLHRLVSDAEQTQGAYFTRLYGKVFAPYLLYNYLLLPGIFVPSFGWATGVLVFACLLLADLMTNAYSFFIIVSNHAGDDIYRFEDECFDSDENALRQILGSVNYRTGSFLNDYLHGYLNYQIEHHLFPDLPPSALHRIQPRVRALCQAHGIPYVQQSVWRRFRALQDIFVGTASMPRLSGAIVASAQPPYSGRSTIEFQPGQDIIYYGADDHGKSILQVAGEQNIKVKSSCTKGKCGRCKMRLIDGQLSGNVIADTAYLCTSFPASEYILLMDY